jgi:hypothetical protein
MKGGKLSEALVESPEPYSPTYLLGTALLGINTLLACGFFGILQSGGRKQSSG